MLSYVIKNERLITWRIYYNGYTNLQILVFLQVEYFTTCYIVDSFNSVS